MFQSRSAQRSQHRAAGLAGDYYTGTSDKDFAAYLAGMREEITRRMIEQDQALAQARKTDHLCMTPRCIECLNNTEIQMARNRLEA
jgi:hypothetical protein